MLDVIPMIVNGETRLDGINQSICVTLVTTLTPEATFTLSAVEATHVNGTEPVNQQDFALRPGAAGAPRRAARGLLHSCGSAPYSYL